MNIQLVPAKDEYAIIQAICNNALTSQLLPKGMTIAAAMTISLKGRELGIPPLMALSEISIVNGKPTLSATLMMALVRKAYPHVKFKFDQTEQECKVGVLEDKEIGWQTFGFSMDDANRAGLLGKPGPWKQYPRAMMRSRAVSEMCRSLFPDALMGAVYTSEELGGEPKETELTIVETSPKTPLKQEPKQVIQQHSVAKAETTPVPGTSGLTSSKGMIQEQASMFDSIPLNAGAPVAPPIQPKTDFIKNNTRVSQPQLKRLWAISNQRGVTEAQLRDIIKTKWGHISGKDLFVSQYDELVTHIQTHFEVRDSVETVQE